MTASIGWLVGWRDRPTVSLPEFARITGMKLPNVKAMVKEGRIPVIHFGDDVLVRTADIMGLFDKPTSLSIKELDKFADEMEAKAQRPVRPRKKGSSGRGKQRG